MLVPGVRLVGEHVELAIAWPQQVAVRHYNVGKRWMKTLGPCEKGDKVNFLIGALTPVLAFFDFRCLSSLRLRNDLSLAIYELPDALTTTVRPLIILPRMMREQTCSANSFTTICTRSSNSCLVFFFCFLIVSTMPEFGPRFHSNSLSTFKKKKIQ